MKRTLIQRVLLALIPVALLATVSLALSGAPPAPIPPATTPVAQPSEEAAPAPDPVPPSRIRRTLVARADDDVTARPDGVIVQAPQDVAQGSADLPDEPLPVLVVDTAPLGRALVDLERAAEQAKLAVTALDPEGQTRYIQESINLLAGFADPAFRAVTANATAETYKGVRPQLIEARVLREAAEVQWIAAVQRQLEARSKRLAEIAQATGTGGTVTLPPATADLSAIVGPTGVLGTRGVRPEEQALEVVNRAIRQAIEALRTVPAKPSEISETAAADHGTAQAASIMESVVKHLETAKKIIQIAINR
jgi:hypothetical protein